MTRKRRLVPFLALAVLAGCASPAAVARAGEPPAFGVESEGFSSAFANPPFSEAGVETFSEPLSEPFLDRGGAAFWQAGGHPFAMTSTIVFNHVVEKKAVLDPDGHPKEKAPIRVSVSDGPKSLTADLPPGVVFDPRATAARCEEASLKDRGACPPSSAVGLLAAYVSGPPFRVLAPLYNMVAPAGMAAQFGSDLTGLGYTIFIDGRVRAIGGLQGGYGLAGEVTSTSASDSHPLYAVVATLWGNPSAAAHDAERGECGEAAPSTKAEGKQADCPLEASQAPETALLSMPSSCPAEPLLTSIAVQSWTQPGVSFPADSSSPAVTGCGALEFEPTIEARPENAAAGSATGLEFDLHVPQNESASPGELASANLKDAVVTLPDGMSVDPSAADGLAGCPLLTGVEPEKEARERNGEEEGINLQSVAPANCPDASKLGTVEVSTPLLESPLHGAIYLAEPARNPFASLLAVYLAVEDPERGIVIKLAGRVEVGGQERVGGLAPGQIRTTFENDPQLPFEDVKVHIFGGERAPLSTPPTCDAQRTSSELTPWSSPQAPGATPSSPFEAGEGAGGSACPKTPAEEPNDPTFVAGSLSAAAGAYSPFMLRLSREDGSQPLKAIDVTLPPGLLGKIAGIEQCPQADVEAAERRGGEGEGALEQADPSCPPASEIGTVEIAAGAGAPIYLKGRAYFSGPYLGAPFSVAIITPAVAGPFDLGTVVVRAGLFVDPRTAQVTVRSGQLPAFVHGVPVDVRSIELQTTGGQLTLNPTSCEKAAVTTTAFGESSETSLSQASLSSPFQVGGCEDLRFEPSLQAFTQGQTSSAGGAGLDLKWTLGAGDANLAEIALTLPPELTARPSTLADACSEAQFDANPAGCPEGSTIGAADVTTPLLNAAPAGPIYVVSHAGAAFPALEIVLQGESIETILEAHLNVDEGIASATFDAIPDVPLSTFEAVLPQGPHSALQAELPDSAKGSLCGQSLTIPTATAGHNGVVLTQSTKVAIEGCGATIAVQDAKVKKQQKLTRAQQLAAALKACRRRDSGRKKRHRRQACERQARKRYGPLEKKTKKK